MMQFLPKQQFVAFAAIAAIAFAVIGNRALAREVEVGVKVDLTVEVEVKVSGDRDQAKGRAKKKNQHATAAEEEPAIQAISVNCEACEAGTCTDANCQAQKCAEAQCEEPCEQAAASELEVSAPVAPSSEAELATPTHRQTKLIKVNSGDLSKTKLNCFCLTRDGRILAGCGTSKENGEIRVYDAEGNYVESWSTPVKVEAINVRASDGMVFVGGDGRLVKLDATGALVANEESPHASVSKEQAEKIRESVIEQAQQRVGTYQQQIKIYDQQIELTDKQIARLAAAADNEPTDEENEGATAAADQRALQLQQLERMKEQLTRTRNLWQQRIEQLGDQQPTEKEIERAVESQIARKLAVASISAVGDQVFIACSAAVGYGYSVWKIDENFESGEEIVSGLRGCCGQMDVQASESGIYVAENSRGRVARFGTDGEELRSWGHMAREGVRGFGSCCNPMNVAFGPRGTVYTAESGSGRIKQYTSEGELLQVVGAADIVPGCKKVSIGATSDGAKVFMLDITRDHIVMMERIPANERDELVAKAAAEAEANEEGDDAQAAASDDADKQAAKSTLRLFGIPVVLP